MNNHFEPYVRNKRDLKVPYISCQDYTNLEQASKLIPALKQINQSDRHLADADNAHTYILRSNNDDDIHKSIKYGIWTSSKENNEKLNAKYLEAQQEGIPVYLFFSVVRSGQFVGVAKLTSGYKEESFQYWWEIKKWKGHFNVQWLYVKDVPNKHFEHLRNSDNIEVTRSRDGVFLSWETGKQMMKIFEEFSDKKSILNDFTVIDEREQALRQYKYQMQQQRNQQQYYPYYPYQYYDYQQYQQYPQHYQQQQQYQNDYWQQPQK
ncbi:unnamed protein product [Paramecium pentaurelia]|uniref:YTH domain-containing protein n=1 Tax=Paramecium pentaurelia TaxID=43138 RepID=A0A8S1SSZ7_9CILI|nr:unnamed protein product [Paramecium pentaurelia]